MTIRRQYSLPNCTLILEGLSDASPATGNQFDARPLMSILVNAECHFSGNIPPLTGGRDFFESLVNTVNRYAQEFLSQVHHPYFPENNPGVVTLEKVADKDLHRLTLLPSAEPTPVAAGSNSASTPAHAVPVQIDLTTVQLFDLVDAVDQFFADSRTLPGISLHLEPVSKRHAKAEQPIAQRSAPVALGVTSLAIAAIALFFVPVPEVRQPRPANSQSEVSETTGANGEGTATPNPEELASAPRITDPSQLLALQSDLRDKIDQVWENRQFNENLIYRVSVTQDGSVIGYRPINSPAELVGNETPLSELLYLPADGSTFTSEPIADFRVVLTRGGIPQVSPWDGFR
ncbi:MAG: DUF4335 domain-containing protein [Kastovskya adunca ATA6-11-RM4]|jgi:hypothetical protein|nr:DUF4335 domain-containing protein [Kastovskya adunca ATA6-11-RM4]